MKLACLAGTTVLCLSLGCSSDPDGTWQSRQTLPNGERNKLELTDDEKGELTMYVQFTTVGGVVELGYDVDKWFLEADGAYEVALTCKTNCTASTNPTLDFEMDCEYDDGAEHLDCDAKAPFSEYGFLEFEPDEE